MLCEGMHMEFLLSCSGTESLHRVFFFVFSEFISEQTKGPYKSYLNLCSKLDTSGYTSSGEF